MVFPSEGAARAVSQTCTAFLFFQVEVLIIRYDKIISHITPTCAFELHHSSRDSGRVLLYSIQTHACYDWIEYYRRL
jgi:hypothetical protein